jgi:hypothetical protein
MDRDADRPRQAAATLVTSRGNAPGLTPVARALQTPAGPID